MWEVLANAEVDDDDSRIQKKEREEVLAQVLAVERRVEELPKRRLKWRLMLQQQRCG